MPPPEAPQQPPPPPPGPPPAPVQVPPAAEPQIPPAQLPIPAAPAPAQLPIPAAPAPQLSDLRAAGGSPPRQPRGAFAGRAALSRRLEQLGAPLAVVIQAVQAEKVEDITGVVRLFNDYLEAICAPAINDDALNQAARVAELEVADGPRAGRAGRRLASILTSTKTGQGYSIPAEEPAIVAMREDSTPAVEVLRLYFQLSKRQLDKGLLWSCNAGIAQALALIGMAEESRPACVAQPDRPRPTPTAAAEPTTTKPKAQRGSAASTALAEDMMRVAKAALTVLPKGRCLSIANRIAGRPPSEAVISAGATVGHKIEASVRLAAAEASRSTAFDGRTVIEKGDYVGWEEYADIVSVFLTEEALHVQKHLMLGVTRVSGVQAFDFLRSALRPEALPTVLPGDEAILKSYGMEKIPDAVTKVPGWASATPAPATPLAATPPPAPAPVYVPLAAEPHGAMPQFVPFYTRPPEYQPTGAAWRNPGEAKVCFTCRLPGHISKFCPQLQTTRPPALPVGPPVCSRCGRDGHEEKDCRDSGKARRYGK
jgi:hypothetical protein